MTVFREKSDTPATPEVVPAMSNPVKTGSDSTVEVPYFDYEQEHGRPLVVDHYQLGDRWNDPVGGFPEEIEAIQTYIKQKIDTGEIANSQNAVKELLKGMEKTNNLTKEERVVVKLGVLSAYVEFLMKQDNIKSNLRKYGQS